ncbi:hypothetical protein JCM1840_003932 [Sporobolomyces johnsonii]
MSARYTQSKAETQRHLEILKGMLKRPENKLCADCKRNDPRWASTNLGCFMCIRCSGIHRGMGVHITRIKSVDLDTWTPEQIANIQRWGNKRANLYWEAHLKPGHMPPEHKMESFIRSKYELKRWAMEGPPPDPETLDHDAESSASAPAAVGPTSSSSRSPAPAPSRKAAPTTSIDLLSAPPSSSSSSVRPTPTRSAPAPQPAATNSLFDLDFGAPTPAPPVPSVPSSAPLAAPATAQPAKRDPKADILSLFSAAPPPRPAQPVQQQPSHVGGHQSQASMGGGVSGVTQGLGGFSLGGGDAAGWGAAPSVGGSGGFGAFTSGAAVAPTATAPPDPFAAASSSIWGSSAPAPAPSSQQQTAKTDPFAEFGAFGSGASNVWGSSGGGGGGGGAKKDQGGGGFSDIWA